MTPNQDESEMKKAREYFIAKRDPYDGIVY